jgi:hypothetical protein
MGYAQNVVRLVHTYRIRALLLRRLKVSENVVGFHPKNKLVNFYEIATEEGNAVWGGEDPHSAVQWLRQAPLNSRLLVSCWEAGEEDARLIIEPIDITKIVFAVMAGAQ